jgi:hypothetical protein
MILAWVRNLGTRLVPTLLFILLMIQEGMIIIALGKMHI